MTKEINILTLEGYYERFNELHIELRSQHRAWIEVESELQQAFGVSRYTTFESFKSSRSRRHKEKKHSRDIFR